MAVGLDHKRIQDEGELPDRYLDGDCRRSARLIEPEDFPICSLVTPSMRTIRAVEFEINKQGLIAPCVES